MKSESVENDDQWAQVRQSGLSAYNEYNDEVEEKIRETRIMMSEKRQKGKKTNERSDEATEDFLYRSRKSGREWEAVAWASHCPRTLLYYYSEYMSIVRHEPDILMNSSSSQRRMNYARALLLATSGYLTGSER